MNFVKNPYNVKSGKYTPHPKRFHSPNTLPFPSVLWPFTKLKTYSFVHPGRKPHSSCQNMWTHIGFRNGAKRLLHQTAMCPDSQAQNNCTVNNDQLLLILNGFHYACYDLCSSVLDLCCFCQT